MREICQPTHYIVLFWVANMCVPTRARTTTKFYGPKHSHKKTKDGKLERHDILEAVWPAAPEAITVFSSKEEAERLCKNSAQHWKQNLKDMWIVPAQIP